MKYSAIILLGVLLLMGCVSKSKSERGTYQQIDMEKAITMMKEKTDYIILDVRTQAEYEEKHIPGAICIPNEDISTEQPEKLPDKEQLIFVYCRSGNRSKQAAKKLAAIGYTQIVEFGGINEWPGEVNTGAES